MLYGSTDMWDLKNKIYEETKHNQTHRYKNRLVVDRMEGGGG